MMVVHEKNGHFLADEKLWTKFYFAGTTEQVDKKARGNIHMREREEGRLESIWFTWLGPTRQKEALFSKRAPPIIEGAKPDSCWWSEVFDGWSSLRNTITWTSAFTCGRP